MNAAATIQAIPRQRDANELIVRAQALVPALRERAAVTSRERQVHPQTIEDFRRLEILRVLQPVRYGGYGSDYSVFTQIVQEVAQGCASSAWVSAVFGEHSWVISMFPEQAQDDVWSSDPNAVASSSFAPNGMARAVPGGFKLNGKWSFSSGCDHAQWIMVGAPLEEDEGRKDYRIFLVPKADVQIEDDWFVIGLMGTGSKSLRIQDVFVPEWRSIWNCELKMAISPGSQVNRDFPICSAPRTLFSSFSLSSVLVGLGRRATELFIAGMRERTSRGLRIADLEAVQLRVAEATAESDTARMIVEQTCRRNIDDLAAGRPVTADWLAWTRRNSVYAARLAHAAVNRVYQASGAAALYDSSPMQMIFRDATAASSHLFLVWDRGAAPHGQANLGHKLDIATI